MTGLPSLVLTRSGSCGRRRSAALSARSPELPRLAAWTGGRLRPNPRPIKRPGRTLPPIPGQSPAEADQQRAGDALEGAAHARAAQGRAQPPEEVRVRDEPGQAD